MPLHQKYFIISSLNIVLNYEKKDYSELMKNSAIQYLLEIISIMSQ
jgi:hypothetical protein